MYTANEKKGTLELSIIVFFTINTINTINTVISKKIDLHLDSTGVSSIICMFGT